MKQADYTIYLEALSSCAIEGNVFAIRMLELKKKDYGEFLIKLEEWAKKEAEER